VASRCAVHPARPGFDACPVCGRPRCHADEQEFGSSGCGACARLAPVRPLPSVRELAIRAGLVGLAVAFVGGWIATQYVRVHLMSLAAPAVVGLAAAFVVPRAARRIRPAAAWLIAVVVSLLGTALGFALTPGGQNPLKQWGVVGGPYLAALVGVVLGPLVFGRPGGSQPPGDDVAALGSGSDR